jgi:excisionase family DNA binding protein
MEALFLPKELPIEFKDLPPLLGTETLARLLGITRAGVVKMLERGDLPGFRVGRLWRVHRADFLEMIGLSDEENE